MSRLRRPFLHDRYVFVTVDLLRSRAKLEECDFRRLAIALARMRQKQRFVLTAWVFLPDHWHAIIYPPHPVSISRAMSAVKVSSMTAINHGRNEKGELWQERFFDHALRTVPSTAHGERLLGDRSVHPPQSGTPRSSEAARAVEVVQLG